MGYECICDDGGARGEIKLEKHLNICSKCGIVIIEQSCTGW